MKLLAIIFLIFVLLLTFHIDRTNLLKQKKGRQARTVGKIIFFIIVIILLFTAWGMYNSTIQPDTQCSSYHRVSVSPPSTLSTPEDYLLQGDYDYQIGNCQQAVADYTQALKLNPKFPQALNNRAYVQMRLRNYPAALVDLNIALHLRPDYVNALMNRGDLYNFYGPTINRSLAVADYQRAIQSGVTKESSVCGHLLLAKHNGWNLGTIVGILNGELSSCL